jgi:hypothetical protein
MVEGDEYAKIPGRSDGDEKYLRETKEMRRKI